MSSLKRASMALALMGAMLGMVVAAPEPEPEPEPKGKQPKRSGSPPITRYKLRDRRVEGAKQNDQPAKEARRAARQANDKQTMERQRAKWGESCCGSR